MEQNKERGPVCEQQYLLTRRLPSHRHFFKKRSTGKYPVFQLLFSLFTFHLIQLAIGEHGEGAKFGIAVLLRNGCKVNCLSHQRQKWKFELKLNPNNKSPAAPQQGMFSIEVLRINSS